MSTSTRIQILLVVTVSLFFLGLFRISAWKTEHRIDSMVAEHHRTVEVMQADFEKTLREQKGQINLLTNDAKQAQADSSSLLSRVIDENSETVESLEEELDRRNEQIRQLEKELGYRNDRIKVRDDKINELETDIFFLEGKLTNAEIELDVFLNDPFVDVQAVMFRNRLAKAARRFPREMMKSRNDFIESVAGNLVSTYRHMERRASVSAAAKRMNSGDWKPVTVLPEAE